MRIRRLAAVLALLLVPSVYAADNPPLKKEPAAKGASASRGASAASSMRERVKVKRIAATAAPAVVLPALATTPAVQAAPTPIPLFRENITQEEMMRFD